MLNGSTAPVITLPNPGAVVASFWNYGRVRAIDALGGVEVRATKAQRRELSQHNCCGVRARPHHCSQAVC
eukprot:COSAG05_NODE_7714_length_777_cov_0.867257_1_plen_69_part_10